MSTPATDEEVAFCESAWNKPSVLEDDSTAFPLGSSVLARLRATEARVKELEESRILDHEGYHILYSENDTNKSRLAEAERLLREMWPYAAQFVPDPVCVEYSNFLAGQPVPSAASEEHEEIVPDTDPVRVCRVQSSGWSRTAPTEDR